MLDDVVNDEPEKPPEQPEPLLLRWLAMVEMTLAGVFLMLILVTVVWQVAGRYVSSISWVGAGEIARYSLVGLTFIVVGVLIGQNGHITILLIDYLVRGRWFVAVKVVSAVLVAVTCAYLVYETLHLVERGWRTGTTVLEIPRAVVYLVPLFGFASGTIRALHKILTAVRPAKTDGSTKTL